MGGYEIFLAVMGFSIIITTMILLYKEISIPSIVMIAVPIFFSLFCGFKFADICAFVADGINGVSKNVILFVFSVMFFGIIADTGIFDLLVGKLLKRVGHDNYAILFCITVLIAIIGHLDGAGATTFLISIPPLLPIYKRLKASPLTLMMLVGLTASVMNVVPWGGPVTRVSSIIGVDPVETYRLMIPSHILGLILIFAIAAYLGLKEKKKHANEGSSGSDGVLEIEVSAEALALRRPKLMWVNGLLIAVVIASLFIKGMVVYLPFVVGTVIALLLNYRSAKEQTARIKAHASDAITMGITVVSVGVLSGVIFSSPIGEAIIKLLTTSIPETLAAHLHSLWGLFASPIQMFLTLGLEESSVIPLVAVASEQYGATAISAAACWLVGSMPAVFFTSATSAMWIGLGLADVSYKDHLRAGTKWVILISMLQVILMFVLGIVKF